jgi:CRP-like cAMP-binding protein
MPTTETDAKTITELLNTYMEAEGVDPKTIEAVADISELRSLEPGEVLFRADKASDHMYIVTDGEVDIQYLLPSGKRQTVDTLHAGDFGVWSAVVAPHTTFSIGICRTAATVVAVEGHRLRELCEEDTHFGYRLLSQLSRVIRRRLQAARMQLAEME